MPHRSSAILESPARAAVIRILLLASVPRNAFCVPSEPLDSTARMASAAVDRILMMKPLRLAMQVALSLRRSRRASSPLMTGSSSRYCPNPVRAAGDCTAASARRRVDSHLYAVADSISANESSSSALASSSLPRDAAVMEPSLWKSADRCCSVAVRAVICAWSYVARYSPSPPRFVSQLRVATRASSLAGSLTLPSGRANSVYCTWGAPLT
mmetsp:Transcript_14289/g.43169  ORF Transcript_14289/g.43169 Transcript_14289/m.43169 type:complete len:212 (-) Transcript_14289:866-1501(-)